MKRERKNILIYREEVMKGLSVKVIYKAKETVEIIKRIIIYVIITLKTCKTRKITVGAINDIID